MKVLIFLLLLSGSVKAQTWDEFFKQKKTQRKYLIQQLAALKMYAGYLKKGYDMTNNGINTIKGFTKGEFDLHEDYFNSFKSINPAIVSKKRIMEIIAFQLAIQRNFVSAKHAEFQQESDGLYIVEVKRHVLAECDTDMDALLKIISSERFELKDDERLKRLEQIHQRMKDKCQFSLSFLNQVKMLAVERVQAVNDNISMSRIYGITN
ncbi:MAG: hypothetical protein JWQ25_2498 [Daejeonella sp.]|nr:hypothetical protein [Daejeonella sp.]